MVKSLFHLYFRSSHHLYFIFLSRVKINSINWPAPNIWVFIAQLVEHCSANAETMGSNPVEAPKFFSGLNLQLLKLRLQLRWYNIFSASTSSPSVRCESHYIRARENEVRERIPVPHDNYLDSIISSRPHCKGYFCLLFP